MAEPLLVVGLGNPGDNYARTRHNLGFMVADLLAARLGSKFKAHKRSGAEVVSGRLAGHSVLVAKPRCFMNESGRQVGPLAKFYSVAPADIIVVHDDLDLDFGRIRLKIGGGEGGHNGLRSVAAALGTKTFSGCASGSAARPAAKTRRRSCWKPSPRPSAQKSPRSASRPPTPPSCSSNWGWSRHKTASTPGSAAASETWLCGDTPYSMA